MMILDNRNTFFEGIAIPATGVAGDVIDLTVARDIGNGQPIYWYLIASGALAGGTSIGAQLVTSDNADLSDATFIVQTPAVPTADILKNNIVFFGPLPLEGNAYKRYIGVSLNIEGTFTVGLLHSGLTLDAHGWRPYKEGQN